MPTGLELKEPDLCTKNPQTANILSFAWNCSEENTKTELERTIFEGLSRDYAIKPGFHIPPAHL